MSGTELAASPITSRRRFPSPWILYPAAGAVLVALPLAVVLAHLAIVPLELVRHLLGTVMPRYLLNTVALVAAVGALAALIGLGAAWLTTMYEFPLRRLLSWALVLPLAIPPYIAAYTVAGTFGFSGPAQRFFRVTLGMASGTYPVLEVANLPAAAVILALVLYPYVYLVCRASFQMQSRSTLETARGLQASSLRRFFRVALPMARPALVGGVALVVMEVLNDYGAVHYLGVDTFTTGIFRAWFSFGQPEAALHLSAVLLVLLLALLGLERRARGRARFNTGRSQLRPMLRSRLAGRTAWLAALACAAPVAAGFLLPVAQLLSWAAVTGARALRGSFLRLTLSSFLLAAAAAALVVVAALLVAFAARTQRGRGVAFLGRLAGMGYAIPGAVIALGIMTTLSWVDRRLGAVGLAGTASRLLLSGTVGALLYAYLIRFFVVGHNPIDAGMERVCDRLDEVARSLGRSPGGVLVRINVPLLRRPLLTAALLVFTDALKELPLTLILRPFGFETLATRAFQLAGNEQVPESAVVSLLIIAVGLAPAVLLVRAGEHGRG